MVQSQRLIRGFFFMSLVGVLAACAAPNLTNSERHNIKGMPEWVMQGTHVVKSDTQRVIHGVKMAALSEMSAQRPFNSYQSNPQPVVPWWSHVTPPAQIGGYSNEIPPIGAATLGNITVQGPVADERARAEVAKVLAAILRQLESNPLAPGGSGLVKTRTLGKDIISEMLKDAKPVARWRDEQSNFLYSLVELDIEHAKERMQYVAGLDPELRGHIETEMEKIFDALAADKVRSH